MKTVLFLATCIWFGAIGCGAGKPPAQEPVASNAPTYGSVAQIFAKHCVMCHAGSNPKAGFDVTSYQKIMAGTKIGPAVQPGDPNNSLIVRAIKGEGVKKMPPKGEPVSAEELARISSWIQAGAKG